MRLSGTAERRQFLRFLIVGSANTVATYALYVLLLNLGLHYRVAITLDYVVGILVGFALNRWWTFKNKAHPGKTLARYALCYVGVFIANFILLSGFVELAHMEEWLAQIPAIGIATILSYIGQRAWVFRT